MSQTPIYNPADMSPPGSPATHNHTHTHPARLVVGVGALGGSLTANPPDRLLVRNYWATSFTITELHYEVRTAPTGSGITIELRKNGVAVHTATISSAATRANYTGLSIAWDADDSLEMVPTAVGATVPGSTLTGMAVATAAGSGL